MKSLAIVASKRIEAAADEPAVAVAEVARYMGNSVESASASQHLPVLEGGGSILFADPEAAVSVIGGHAARGNRGRTIVMASRDGTMESMRRLTGLVKAGWVDRLIVFSPHQELFAEEVLGMSPERLELIPPPVDVQFFHCADAPVAEGGTLFFGFRSEDSLPPVSGNVERFPSVEPSAIDTRSLLWRSPIVAIGSPSRAASGGQVLLARSMACGCAVVVPRTFTLEHLVANGEDGILYEPNDLGELTRAIRLLQADRDLAARLAHGARRRVVDMMSMQHFAARVALVVRRTADGRNDRSFAFLSSQVASA